MKQVLSSLKDNITFLMLCFFFLMLSMLAINSMSAQEVIPNPADIVDQIKDATDWTGILGVESLVYTFLITVVGWFSAFIPGLRSIESGTYRILVWAILVIAGSLVIGVGNVWVGAISYFFSTSLYEVVIKWIIPSPKPSEVPTLTSDKTGPK